MNQELRNYLESIGLSRDASAREAWEFYGRLEGEQRERALSLRGSDAGAGNDDGARGNSGDQGNQGNQPQGNQGNDDGARGDAGTGGSEGDEDPRSSRISEEIRAAERRERQRIEDILRLATEHGIDNDVAQRAISRGLTVDQASREFLASLRGSRQPAQSASGPAVHSRSRDGDRTLDVLQGAVLLREGVAIDNQAFRPQHAAALRGMPRWLTLDINNDERQRAMDLAHQFAQMSLVDICREAVRLDGGRPSYNHDEMIRAAVSGSSLSAIFSAVVNASLLAAYMDAPDTTQGWVAEVDVPNFLPHERSAMGKFGKLSKLPTGAEAEHLDTDDAKETSRIARYAGQFVVDEQDIINDRFGAIESMTPADMGNVAAQLRPDLLYSILLANPAMDSDGVALFHSSHNNIDTNAFNATNLETGIAKMAQQRIKSRPLNIRARYLLVPHDLRFRADIELTSAERRNQAANDSGTRNPLADLGIIAVADDRIGAAGVVDPDSGTSYTGSATNWFLAARPGEAGARTLVVKYRRGTGRVPQIRSFPLTQGRWGIAWDVKHDIGADADDYRGLYKGNS